MTAEGRSRGPGDPSPPDAGLVRDPARSTPTPPLPPPELRFMGETDDQFLTIGERTLRDLEALCLLRRQSSVLDVGCGYGRLAHALVRSGGFAGEYLGLDILPRQVEWCRSHLGPFAETDRFEFILMDIENERYNPTGQTPSTAVTLPVPDESIDVLAAESLVTHMRPLTVTAYLREFSRVLRPGGRALVTLFLIDDFVRAPERHDRLLGTLPHKEGVAGRYHSASDPLHMVALDDRWLEDELRKAGLAAARPTRLGSWFGRPGASEYLDALILEPRPRPSARRARG